MLTYEKMTDDLAALLDHLKTGPVNVFGWSDGGIEALLLGIRHPAKVKKIASMAANLNPTDRALYPEVIGLVKTILDGVPAAAARNTPEGKREIKVTGMMLAEPNIDVKALASHQGADARAGRRPRSDPRRAHAGHFSSHPEQPARDLCRTPRTWYRIDDAAAFNAVLDRFFRTPFVKKDRIGDTMKSLEKLRSR